jgi:hypothetical protein
MIRFLSHGPRGDCYLLMRFFSSGYSFYKSGGPKVRVDVVIVGGNSSSCAHFFSANIIASVIYQYPFLKYVSNYVKCRAWSTV